MKTRIRIALCAVVVCVAGCGGPAEPSDGGGGDGAMDSGPPGDRGEPRCTDDAACNDGVYCNGDETCDAGACTAGTPPCAAAMCNEAPHLLELQAQGGGRQCPAASSAR